MAAAAERVAYAFPQLSDVELQIVVRIFSLLPLDQRTRCAEVSHAWRATVALPALWRRVVLPPAHVANPWEAYERSSALLHAAFARAGDALRVLDVSCFEPSLEVFKATLCAAPAVTEVHAVSTPLTRADVLSVLTVAPRLRSLHAEIQCAFEDPPLFLEPPAPLCVRALQLKPMKDDTWDDIAPLPPFLTRALSNPRLHPDLTCVMLFWADLRAHGAMEVLADAVCARPRLTALEFVGCHFSPATAPALARMVQEGALTALGIYRQSLFFDRACALTVAAALRASRTLTSLDIQNIEALRPAVGAALLGALVGHRSLRTLNLECTVISSRVAAGAALAALVAADAPALTELSVSCCDLRESGLGPLLDALPHNRHLRVLDITSNCLSGDDRFIHKRLLPAVRTNGSLRTLTLHLNHIEHTRKFTLAVEEACGIVAARRCANG